VLIIIKIALNSLWYHHTYIIKIALNSLWYHHTYIIKIALNSLWYHHIYRCDDTRGCLMQF